MWLTIKWLWSATSGMYTITHTSLRSWEAGHRCCVRPPLTTFEGKNWEYNLPKHPMNTFISWMESRSYLAIVTVFHCALCLLINCHGHRCMLPLTFDNHKEPKVVFVLTISSVNLIPRLQSSCLLLVVEVKQGGDIWMHCCQMALQNHIWGLTFTLLLVASPW